MLLGKKLDKTTPIPLYFQLKELIMSEIKNGSYPKDSMIPTEKELSDMFGISRTTVRQAITEMVQEGWLYRVKSKGTFVSQPKINQDFIQKLESYNDQIVRTGRTPYTEVLDFKVEKAKPEVAEHLNIRPEDPVVFLYRKRYADDEPIVVLKTYLPYDRCSFVMEHDFTKESLYSVLSRDDSTRVYCVKRLVEAVEATASDAEILDMKKGKPIQFFSSVGVNVFGQPIEFSLARYRGDRNSFEVTVFTDK
ncbi:GntR family transcriptional regulator [Candidatus Merdisoma sp. HCP28S3_D10]|uniref:GntR family transcriptional regulator n=1 Tax=unclassified Candidatus Merdisoma TaxID=3099611 RepID=UPI003F8C9D5F